MKERVFMASEFKARCLALIDQVGETRVPILITKHGRPLARLVPLDEDERRPTMGSVSLLAEDDAAYYATGEDWDAAGG